MKLTPGAYIILQLNTDKPALARCTHAEGDDLRAVLEKEKDKDSKSPPIVKFQKTDLIAVLGKRPKVGGAYGLKIEPLVRRENFKFWGDARIYNWFDDHQMELLREVLDKAYRKLKKLNVIGSIPFELEVRQPQGKYAGMYKFRPKAETDVLIVKPTLTMDQMDYYLFHEYAHGIWYRMLTPKMRLRWVRMYTDYTTLLEIKEKELKTLREDVEAEGSIRAYMAGAEDETKLQLKEILKHITTIHGITVKHLEWVLENDESLEDYWPTNIEMSEKEMVISDYAKKSPEEFFAEAVSFKFLERRIPKKIEELYEKTMARLIKSGPAPVEEAKKDQKKKKDDNSTPPKSVRIDHGSPMAPDSKRPVTKKKKKGARKEGLA